MGVSTPILQRGSRTDHTLWMWAPIPSERKPYGYHATCHWCGFTHTFARGRIILLHAVCRGCGYGYMPGCRLFLHVNFLSATLPTLKVWYVPVCRQRVLLCAWLLSTDLWLEWLFTGLGNHWNHGDCEIAVNCQRMLKEVITKSSNWLIPCGSAVIQLSVGSLCLSL